MDALVGGRSAGIRYIGKAALLASVSGAALALACWLPVPAMAADYLAGSDAELRGRITQANGDGDPTSTITLTASFPTAASSLPVPTKPITIDTQGFTLSGINSTGATVGGTINIIGVAGPSDSFTLQGNFKGGDAQAASGGSGISARLSSSVTNFGTILGGNSTGGAGGFGVDLGGTGTDNLLINHGTIRGGTGATGGGIGLNVRTNTAPIVNTGTIEGGAGAVAIRGTTTLTLNNSGTVQGGSGAAAITTSSATASLNLVNSGTIRAGAGQTDAIALVAGSTGLIDLELQAGSVIEGNVVAGAGADDVLRLGGSADASFDVSAIGPSAQYRNFNAFIKNGTSTWTLTGTGASAIPLSVQQGMLLVTGSTLGPVGVLTGATLGGTGTIAGDVTIDTNGTLAPGAAGGGAGHAEDQRQPDVEQRRAARL